MTQEEYEQKKRECFVKFCKDNGIDQKVNISIFDAFDQIFDRAYALGKQEKDAEDTVIRGWVAVDDDGDLFLYRTKPARDEVSLMWMSGECPLDVGINLFPNLTWESDPQEVEIIIKRKKK